jgi:thiamine-monophosphate kinase
MSGDTVRDIGEFGAIARLQKSLPLEVAAGPDLRIGIGDDTAIWRPPANEDLIMTTDAMIEGIHFDLAWTSWWSLGWKALAVNISDVASMGGLPRLALVTLGLSPDLRIDDLIAVYQGMGSLAQEHGVLIAGGDIVGSPRELLISVTLTGVTKGRHVLERSGARPGDTIGVSGTLGAAAAGLRLLRLPHDDPRRSATTAPVLIEALHEPQPRIALGQILIDQGATAAMDVSDGLLGDLPKILEASGVAGTIEAARIPVPAAVRALFPETWLDLALRGGEDYELLFTAPPAALEEIASAAATIGQTVTRIGTIQERSSAEHPLTLIGLDGMARPATEGAWDHFQSHGA